MADIPKFFLNVGFPIINPLQCKYQLFETGTNKPLGEVKIKDYQQEVKIDKETGNIDVLLYPDFTEEQKQIENKYIKMYKPVYEITPNELPRPRQTIPVQYVRPPKPNKKWSRRYK